MDRGRPREASVGHQGGPRRGVAPTQVAEWAGHSVAVLPIKAMWRVIRSVERGAFIEQGGRLPAAPRVRSPLDWSALPYPRVRRVSGLARDESDGAALLAVVDGD